jgi:hypothetical protein
MLNFSLDKLNTKSIGVTMASKKSPVGPHKGPNFERELCRMFSLWISNGKTKDILWRTHGSGGFATNLRKQGRVVHFQGGDIGLLDPQNATGIEFLQNFIVEAKHLQMQYFWPGAAGWLMLEKFWTKVNKEGEGRVPLLVVKINFQETLVFMPTPIWRALQAMGNDNWNGTMYFPNYKGRVGFVTLDFLLKKCDYQSVLILAKQLVERRSQ